MSPSFQCVSGVSNKYNLGKLYFDEREKVKKKNKTPDLLSALMSKLIKGRKFMSHIFYMQL